MKKLFIISVLVVAVSTFVSCTKEAMVDETQTEAEALRSGFDPMGLGPGIEPG